MVTAQYHINYFTKPNGYPYSKSQKCGRTLTLPLLYSVKLRFNTSKIF